MKTYTIEQKESNTGSIHDIASDMYDREIKFPAGHQYAVVLAAYYGGRGYTVHRTDAAAANMARKIGNDGYSYTIIDSAGDEYMIDFDGQLCGA